MRISDWSSDVCSSDLGRVDAFPEPPGLAGGNLASGATPFVFLALAMCWVGLLSAGVPYPVFWWVAMLAMCGAWILNLRGGTREPPAARAGKHAAWYVASRVVRTETRRFWEGGVTKCMSWGATEP